MKKQAGENVGVIRVDELYSKQEILQRMGVSQKVWDKMLDEGLPFIVVGHQRWVWGRDLIEHLSRQAERKRETNAVVSEV